MYRLALGLGCTVAELSERMTLKEIYGWMAYYNIEPWGSSVDGLRHAATASTMANVGLMIANPKRLRSRPFNINDFTVGTTSKKVVQKRQSWEQQKALFNAFCPIGKG